METILVNKFKNCKSPLVDDTITLSEWFNDIKDSTHQIKIDELRGLYITDRKKYDSDKASQLPTVTYNFKFRGKRNNESIIQSSGVLFLEVDGKSHPEFTIDSIDTSKVYAYYKSLSNNGYHIIVRVEGLTYENFKSYHAAVCKELDLTKYQDDSAVKKTQPSIISSDPDIYINNNCKVFSFDNLEESEVIAPIVLKKDKKEYVRNESELYNFRFDNVSEIIQSLDFKDKNYYTDWNGVNVIRCLALPNTIKDGSRQSALLSYCTNLVILNPNATIEQVGQMMSFVNTTMCINPVNAARLKNVIDTIFKQKYSSGLTPTYNVRKIFFDTVLYYTKEEKLEIVNELLTEKRISESNAKIVNAIEEWDWATWGKITQTKIAQHFPINKKTVVKYWGEYKDTVKGMNEEFKTAMKAYEEN